MPRNPSQTAKPMYLRLDPEVLRKLREAATEDCRSMAKEAEYLLKHALSLRETFQLAGDKAE